MSESINTVVVGAGAVGLACARALALAGHEVIAIERTKGIGRETSSRNSEVIHSGIYYEPDSLKARLCVAGRRALYEYCSAKAIPHRRIGKLIVATQRDGVERLRHIDERARRNGVDDLQWLDADAVHLTEPAIEATAALLSPSTGIFDTHAFMLALQGDLEAAGGHVVLHAKLSAAQHTADGLRLNIETHGETTSLVAKNVVNCGGLHASNVASILHGDGADIPSTRYARGVYFDYADRAPFTRLIYPLPEPGGLGVHATLDMSGAVRFGPDVEWVEELDYTVDPGRAAAFAAAIECWWPAVEASKLKPAYAGIRPKLSEPGAPAADFRITRTKVDSGCIVDLLGIESPGLTSALAIAEHVRALLR